MSKKNKEVAAETVTVETPVDENPTIQIVDLANALSIIDAAAERGAFKGNELTQVGAVRDRLAIFLKAVAPQPDNAETSEVDAEVTE